MNLETLSAIAIALHPQHIPVDRPLGIEWIPEQRTPETLGALNARKFVLVFYGNGHEGTGPRYYFFSRNEEFPAVLFFDHPKPGDTVLEPPFQRNVGTPVPRGWEPVGETVPAELMLRNPWAPGGWKKVRIDGFPSHLLQKNPNVLRKTIP